MPPTITRKVMAAGPHRRLVWFGMTASADHWDANWSALDIARSVDSARADFEFLPLIDRYVGPGKRVLEAGCGLGQWVMVLRERGYAAFGVDYVVEALRTAATFHPGDAVLARGDIRKLPFADDTFDAVTSFGVVEHFWGGPSPLIEDMVRVLKPGGVMFLSVPHFNALRKVVTWRPRKAPSVAQPEPDAFYQFAYERTELLEHLRAAGLTIVETVGTSAAKGLKDELPLVGALRQRLNASESAAREAAASPTATARPQKRSLARRVRSLLQRFIYSRPVSNFAGHMIMVVCRKEPR